MRRAIAALLPCVLAISAPALADPAPTPAPATFLPPPVVLGGETSGDHSAFEWATPMRLTLTGLTPPMAGAFSGCDSRTDAAGNSVNGFAIRRFALLDLGPHLVLSGFSVGGCPVDAGAGAAVHLGFDIVRGRSWLVLSAGVYAAPGLPANAVVGIDGRMNVALRLDYVWKTKRESTRSLGVGTSTATGVGGAASRNTLVFGGAW